METLESRVKAAKSITRLNFLPLFEAGQYF